MIILILILILVLVLVSLNRDLYLIIELYHLTILPFRRLLMIDVDDDGFKIYTASRPNKARGLTKGRAAPCKSELIIKYQKYIEIKYLFNRIINFYAI